MPASDILNPTPSHLLNPDYGWQRKRPVTHIATKANQGPPYFREMTDVGHQFLLNWGITGSEREFHDVNKLKWYYEQYRDGFFTLIDHEGDGRHYVGRFTSPVEPIAIGHNRWSVQQVLFEEVPGVPMVRYPDRWIDDHHGKSDAIWRYPVSDFGEVKVAVDNPANWSLLANGAAHGGNLVANLAPIAGSWVQMAYVGWGFSCTCSSGLTMGRPKCGSMEHSSAPLTITLQPSYNMAWEQTNVHSAPHREGGLLGHKKFYVNGTIIAWNGLRVMR